MKNPRRPLLIGGACLLAAGAALFATGALPWLAPWLVLAGGLMAALFFVLSRVAKAPEGRDAQSILYEEGNTTMLDEMSKGKDE